MTCDQCDATISGEPTRTATRTLCRGCGERFVDLTVGYASTGSIGGAVSTARWYRVMRKIRRGRG